MRTGQGFCLVVALSLVAPLPLVAQTPGGIAGVARDSSGAVLPGVTVEAASPALIEKVRSAVSDSQGQYKIVDLRPGTYAVTFTLAGFKIVRREGIEVTSGFTATVNADMSLGGIEETITVSGASPVVDIQNSRTQNVFSDKLIEAVPVSRTEMSFVQLTLGMVSNRQDVGGAKGELNTSWSIHGSPQADAQALIDGMHFKGAQGSATLANHVYKINQFAIQEMAMTTGAMTAETETGGPQLNYVPKDGGNTFNLMAGVSYANNNMQGDNLSADLIARGLLLAQSIRSIQDYGVGFGGPLRQDKLWFYTAHRVWGSQEYVPATWWNKTQGTPFYTPDLSRPGYADVKQRDHGGRLTWNVTQKQKITATAAYQNNCFCHYNLTSERAPEASTLLYYKPVVMLAGTWAYVVSSRFIVDAGVMGMNNAKPTELPEGVTLDTVAITDSGIGVQYNAQVWSGLSASGLSGKSGNSSDQINGRVGVAYVTGSHAFKVGMQQLLGFDHRDAIITGGGVSYTFRLGVPTSLTQWATPAIFDNRVLVTGLYAQDQWTLNRLTLNLGVRYDNLRGWTKPTPVPAGPFLPARNFEKVSGVPIWNDIAPRVGASYDVFGNGRTAVKAFVGRYVQTQGAGVTEQINPANAVVTSTNRTWNDALFPVGDPRRGNFSPDCVLTNFDANGECGAIDNRAFGTVRLNRRYDPKYLEGFGVRPYTWQGQVALQQELRPGMALNVGYYRTWYGNFTVTENAAISPSDYDAYCVTAPADSRLPGGGGNQLCGLYDLKPSAFGRVDNFVTYASNFGEHSQVYNGVDVSINARFAGGALVTGGVSTGRTVTDTCYVVDSPQANLFCRVSPPLMAGTQFKATVVYPLPWWGLQTSLIYQNLTGGVNEATRTFTNTEIAPSLGRNLSGCPATGSCTATRPIPLYETQSVYEDRSTQLDFRVSKAVRFGRARLQTMFDVNNLFNANSVLGVTSTYGPNWRRPSTVLGPRLFKVGAQVDF